MGLAMLKSAMITAGLEGTRANMGYAQVKIQTKL